MINLKQLLSKLLLVLSLSYTCMAVGSEFTVMIVSGHVAEPRSKPNTVGAMSYSGADEYAFNDAILALFALPENQLQGIDYQLVYARENRELKERSWLANTQQPDMYIEIHHDSARQSDREKAQSAGYDSPLWDAFHGFSVHFSTDSDVWLQSQRFAEILGSEMVSGKFNPNHYLARTMGMRVVDEKIGLYNRIKPHGLYIFRAIKVPAVVLEAGNIANPHEEAIMSSPETRHQLVDIINSALTRYISEK